MIYSVSLGTGHIGPRVGQQSLAVLSLILESMLAP